MRIFLIILLFMFSVVDSAYSYPEIEMEKCMSSALSNPATKSISKDSIANYCDCVLIAIIDENKDIRDSGYECALKHFN